MSTIIQGISSSGINGCISHTSSISKTDHNMSTNAKHPTCDIKTDHVIPNEAAYASSEVEISSDMPVTKNVVKRKQDKPDKGSESNSEIVLDQLGLNLTGTIIMMLGRMWDVSAVTGRYLSIDFVVSDAKGNMIHCSAKATMSYNFLRLKEGGIYFVKIFAVKPNKDEYRILKNDVYMLEFNGSTTISKASVKADGFVRYPFQLYVTNVGTTNHLKSSSRNLDFHLANHSPSGLHFGVVNDALIDKKTKQTGVCPVILSAACPKKYNNKVYLSSTSSTVIYDDDAILAIKALKKANTTRKEWKFPSCGSDTCKKGLTCTGLKWTCQTTLLRLLLLCSMKPLLLWLIVLQTPSWIQWMRMDVDDYETEDSSDSANAKGKRGY
nr:hypothetical protein [Tanacetum cinerariifolium]